MIVGHKIKLDTFDRVKKFISIVDKFENDVDIISGRYLVDAKSVMGIFSLDLTRPLTVIIHDASMKDVAKLEELMEEFRVDDEL